MNKDSSNQKKFVYSDYSDTPSMIIKCKNVDGYRLYPMNVEAIEVLQQASEEKRLNNKNKSQAV